MMMRSFLVAVTSLFLCQATLAQNVSARIDWYGVYTAKNSEEIDDPTSPTGKRFITTPVPPASNTDQIPGRDNVRFGYSYTVTGGRAGSLVTIKHVYRFPGRGMPDKVAGGRRTTFERERQNKIGESVLMGWSFEGAPPERLLTGDWVLEVWSGGRKLVEKRFNVYAP
jgi:hypothetical protein